MVQEPLQIPSPLSKVYKFCSFKKLLNYIILFKYLINLLMKVDLPALGLPKIAIFLPSGACSFSFGNDVLILQILHFSPLVEVVTYHQ